MKICALVSSTPSHRVIVGTLTPSGAARSVLGDTSSMRIPKFDYKLLND